MGYSKEEALELIREFADGEEYVEWFYNWILSLDAYKVYGLSDHLMSDLRDKHIKVSYVERMEGDYWFAWDHSHHVGYQLYANLIHQPNVHIATANKEGKDV